MNFTGLFIRRPVMTTLVMAGILIFGLVAYRQLPVSDLPAVDYPTISVSASLSGASPETMASAVATPLEKQFSTIPGIEAMTSTSGQGSTQISLQFALSRNIDAAAQDVQAAISQAQRQLPQDMLPPSFRKVDPSSSPIVYYALRSNTMPLSQLDEYAETFLAQRLSTVDGVAQVQVYGSQKYAVRIQLDPQQLSARSIGIDEVATAVQNGNVNVPTGILWGTDKAYAVESQGQLTNAAGFAALVVAYRDGAPVRLGDLGNVLDSVQDTKQASWFNGQRAIVLAIQRQPGTNTVEVAQRVKDEVEQLRPQLPASVDMATLYDRSETVKASVADVKFTLFLALCLVVMVIFLFLRNVRATTIPALALPMSLVGTFAVMYLLGYSLDNLSLMALTLAVGLRGRRRDRGAGERRAPSRAGRVRDGRGGQRQPGDQLHRDLDDAVAGGGVHSGPAPRRADRSAVPGIRGHDRGGNPGLGLRLAHADAHAVQPLAQARGQGRGARPVLSGRPSAPGRPRSPGTSAAWPG